MSRYRNRNSFQNTFKDYLVPIIGWVLLLILLYSLFSGGWNDTPTTTSSSENQNPVSITFDTIDDEVFIVYPGEKREQINESEKLYKWERIIVKSWWVDLSFENGTEVALNKISELKYNQDSSLSLYSSDAWISLWEDTEIAMKYANITSSKWSVLSLTQNEAGSTLYVLSWNAKVTNLGGVSTSLIKGQKINVSRLNAANSEIDLSAEKWNIDSYFKGSDWFIENEGHIILEKQEAIVWEWGTSSGSSSWTTTNFVSFDNLSDEMSTNNSSITVTGKILQENISSITIDNKQVNISEDTSFSLEGVNTSGSINDLVVKVYSDDKSILDKQVFTVYSSGSWTPTSTSSNNNSSTPSTPVNGTNSQGVTTYSVDGTDFGFTQPSVTGKFSTTSNEVTIRWITTAKGISKVQVNGFTLASFNGSTWRYHAFTRFETLEAGTNQYKVDYFDEDDKVVYTDYYTIVKKSAAAAPAVNPTPTPSNEEEIISDEA